MIFKSARQKQRETLIAGLYGKAAAAARHPLFFTSMGAADTVEGRFELLTLHMALVLRRLGELPPPADEVSFDLTDHFFLSLDGALREIGIGDTGIGRRMKSLASGFLGRAQAYGAALDGGEPQPALAAALIRNVYSGEAMREADAARLAGYAVAASARLSRLGLDALLSPDAPLYPDPLEFSA